MKRIPIWSSLFVLAAVATMVSLGIWQLQRAAWKERLLARYAAARNLPPVPFPDAAQSGDPAILYRRTKGACHNPSSARAIAGRNATGHSGMAHMVTCSYRPLPRPVDQMKGAVSQFGLVLGWSESPNSPRWVGGVISGTIAPDSMHGFRIIADPPLAGLQANAAPSLDDIPNNHFAYAMQWFFFAGTALVIYALALRRRAASGA